MPVVSVVVGATTESSAVVVGQVDAVSSVRLAVDADELLTAPTFVGPESPSTVGMVRFQVDGLDAASRYWFRLEADGALDGPTGRFRTHPARGQPAEFTIAAAGDAGRTPDAPPVSGTLIPSRMSNNPVHSLIADEHDPLMFIHLGDEDYYNIGSGETWDDEDGNPIVLGHDLATYRRQYEDVLRQTHQHYLARRVARAHFWDDHEFGPNDSDRTAPGRDNACLAYREREPHYPLPAGSGANPVHQWWQIGRIGFLAWDERADRDPNGDPAAASKTMIGSFGRTWTQQRLAAARDEGVEFLVIISPSSWLGFGADSWGSFTDERDLLVSMLDEHGWSDRMLMMCADIHLLAIEDGSNNFAGGFPVFQFAPLDASPSAAPAHDYSDGFQNEQQSGQYGLVQFVDDGDSITVTGTGLLNGTAWHSITFSVSTEPPEPEPEPGPPPVATAAIRRRVTWYGVHATTGRIIAELPDVSGAVGRLLSASSSHRLDMPIPLSGPGHVPIALVEQATQPVSTAVVAVVNDLPTWMGWILSRRGGTDATLRLATATPEAYLRRRRVRDHTFSGVDRAQVAAVLVGDAGGIEGVGSGLGFTLDVQLTGESIDRQYAATDRETVYDALRELCADGLEFTVDLDWVDSDMTAVRKILRIGPRVGVRRESPALFETTASAVFGSQSGAEATYELAEDWASGKAANYVTAVAPGEGEDQPASAPAIDTAALAGGVPIVEHVLDVSAANTSQGNLDRLAAAELELLRGGAQVWDLSVRLDAYPRLGVDAQIGDDVVWNVVGHRHPDGVLGSGRMIGYQIDQDRGRWSPVLLNPGEEVV